MLQNSAAWTKLPHGARTCPTPVQYLAPHCGGGQVGFLAPERQSGTKDPPDSVQCLPELPQVWGQGTTQPCHCARVGLSCWHWGGQSGNAPSLHPQEMWGSLPLLETCACGLVGFF